MKAPLRLPAILAVAVLTAAGTTVTVSSCGSDDPPPPDAMGSCGTYCLDTGSGSGSENCPFPTCTDAQGQCPADCTPVG